MLKKIIIGFILSGMTLSACQGQKVKSCDINILNEELSLIHQKDQQIRNELMPVLGQYQKDGSGQLKLFSLALKMNRQDKQNQEYILSMLEKCGWPEALNEQSHNTVFLVLQHSPDSIMKAYFPQVQKMVKKGILLPDDEAIMLDRILMDEGKPQRYGSQTFAANNINYIWPIESLDSLESFRKEVGLPSMEDYILLAKDSFQIEYTWNKEMTIEEAISLKEENNN